MSAPVFLPLMVEDMPDTADRVRRDVQAIPFALPEIGIRFSDPVVRHMTNEGSPVVFRIGEGDECP